MLVVFGSHFQFGDGARVVAFTLQWFGVLVVFLIIVCADMHIATMLVSMAFEYLAVFSQLLAIVLDDLGVSVVRLVAGDHQVDSECLGENAKIDRVVVIVLQASAGIERQPRFVGTGVVSDVQVAEGTANVEVSRGAFPGCSFSCFCGPAAKTMGAKAVARARVRIRPEPAVAAEEFTINLTGDDIDRNINSSCPRPKQTPPLRYSCSG